MISVGDVYCWWVVMDDTPKRDKGKTYFFCKCKCGHERWVCKYYMEHGKSKSCGCRRHLLHQ